MAQLIQVTAQVGVAQPIQVPADAQFVGLEVGMGPSGPALNLTFLANPLSAQVTRLVTTGHGPDVDLGVWDYEPLGVAGTLGPVLLHVAHA